MMPMRITFKAGMLIMKTHVLDLDYTASAIDIGISNL
jgi:hypothetical protein